MLWSCLDQPDLFVSELKLPPFILFLHFFFVQLCFFIHTSISLCPCVIIVLSSSLELVTLLCSNLGYYYYFLFVSLYFTVNLILFFCLGGLFFFPPVAVLLGQIPGLYLCLPANLRLSLSERRCDEMIPHCQHYLRSALFQCPWHTIVNRDKQHNRLYHMRAGSTPYSHLIWCAITKESGYA